MSVVHKITGYDRSTELMTFAHDIPSTLLVTAREIARVPSTDREAVGSYPLEPEQVQTIALRIGARVNVEAYDWFLEPFSEGP